MRVTENLLILGLFPIFAIGMQALPTVVQYELPPPVPLPSYTHSQIFLSQYLDVPMLSIEEMEHAFPWLKFTKPTNIQAQEQPFQNEEQYTFYYSPAKVILNKNTNNLYSNVNFLNDEAKDQYQHKGNLFVPSKPDTLLNIDTTDNLSQIRLQEEGKLHSDHQHKDFAPNFLRSSSTEQDDVAGIDEISLSGKSTIGQLNVRDSKNSSYPNVEREYDNLENERNIKLNGCHNNGKKHCKQTRNRQISKEKFICGKKCEERNNDDDKSQNNYPTNDELLSDRTKESNEQLFKSRDNCMEELVKRNPDGLDNCETHNAESKRRPVYLYPKVPSAYLEPPKLAADNYQFYRKQKRKLSNRKRPKQNAVRNRLQNHKLDSKEKNAVDLEEKLKNHKTEYIRDHAPEHQKEETTTPKEVDVDEHKKKKPSNPFELSPNGERVEFQIHGYDGPKSYIFGFDTGAGKNRHFRLEERLKDGTVKGHYGYYDATGKLRMVQYTAKPLDGYQEKHHESSNHKPES